MRAYRRFLNLPVLLSFLNVSLVARALPTEATALPTDDGRDGRSLTSVVTCRLLLNQVARASAYTGATSVASFLNCPPTGCTPVLNQAIAARDWDLVQELLEWGADPNNELDTRNPTALKLAEQMGEAPRLQELMQQRQGAARAALQRLGYNEEIIDAILVQAPPLGSNMGAWRKAMDQGEYELIRHLAEKRGHPLSLPLDERSDRMDPRLIEYWSNIEYKLWAMGVLADDGGQFFAFLQREKSQLLPLSDNLGLLGLFVGKQTVHIPKNFQGKSAPFDREKFLYLLQQGLNPVNDKELMQTMAAVPHHHREVWRVLLMGGYPHHQKFIENLPKQFEKRIAERRAEIDREEAKVVEEIRKMQPENPALADKDQNTEPK